MKHTETINLQQLREEYKAKIIEFLNGNEVELKFDFAPFDIIVSMIEQILLELNYKADYDYVQNTKSLGNFTCYIYLGAKNENGRQAINDIISEANLTGFYRQAIMVANHSLIYRINPPNIGSVSKGALNAVG